MSPSETPWATGGTCTWRDRSLASGEPFQVADLALDAAALDELWDGLDRVDSHFWEMESLGRIRRDHAAQDPLPRPNAWWKFWAKEAENLSRTIP